MVSSCLSMKTTTSSSRRCSPKPPAGNWRHAPSLARHRRCIAEFVRARADYAIHLESRTVEVDIRAGGLVPAQQTFSADHLVVALGSVVNLYNTPGVADNAIPMKRLQDASRAF